MSCTNPNLVRFAIDDCTGLITSKFIGSAHGFDVKKLGNPYVDPFWYSLVPCGKCLSCRCDYSREWSNRMILELTQHSDAIFVTLTYNNDNLPFSDEGFPTLNKRDCQLFFKRLRKHFSDRRIRYYIAGEYGSRTYRPHYHAIIYGIGISDFPDLDYRGTNEIGSPFYTSLTLEKLWSNGFVLFSDVTWRTCNYVARYVIKKQVQIDEVDGVALRPFNLSSRNPGLGMDAARDLIFSGNSIFPIDGRDGIHEIPIPSSIVKRLKVTEDDFDFSSLMYSRSMFARQQLIDKITLSGKSLDEFNLERDRTLKNKLNILPERK